MYTRITPLGTLGLGVAVFVIVTLVLFALGTEIIEVALLPVRLGTTLEAVAVSVSAMFVPDAVPEFTCRTSEKLAVAFKANVLAVQVMVPALPTPGFVQVQPVGAVID
jgi:hypothetical protein